MLAGIGALDYWGSRYNLNPDGISYLEMAGKALAEGPGAFINGYWSPAYPLLLAPVRWLAPSDWAAAIPALHAVNLAVFGLTAAVFLWLLRRTSRDTLLARFAMPFGAATYAVIAVQCIGLGLLTPDFAVMLCVLATAACCVMLERSTSSSRWAVALGVVLGAGYWSKGILLPLNAVLVVLLLLMPPRVERARRRVMLAALVFALVSLPLVVLVSRKVGHVTAGEVGRLNYAWEINAMSSPWVGWVGDSGNAYGVPLHPPRVLQESPRTLEFAAPIRSTYPLWFDPSYWNAGLTPHLDLAGHRRALAKGMADLRDVLLDQWVVVVGVVLIWLSTRRDERRERRDVGTRHTRVPLVLTLWSAVAALLYAAVHLEARYLAGFIAVSVVAAWIGIARRTPRRVMPWTMTCVVIAMFVSLGLNLQKNIGGFERTYRPDYVLEGEKLRAAGVRDGDPLAMVGDAHEAYAAFVAGAWIAAQVMDSTGFWALTPAARRELQERLAATGISAVLANNVAGAMAGEGWQILARPDSSNVAVLLLKH